MSTHRLFIRNINTGSLMETFLISAVAAVLGIRFFLHLTGYPQISGGGLHIAHMLWGGLLMLIALFISMSFLSKASDQWAALLGGFGFGTFIDEIGKFVTADNNYFFQPAVSLMYITFILIFLGIRWIQTYRRYSSREYTMNALRELEDVISHDLDKDEKDRAMGFLKHSDQNDPVAQYLKELFDRIELVPVPKPSRVTQIKQFFRNLYRNVVHIKGFNLALILFFVGQLVIKLINAFVLVFLHGFGWTSITDARIIGVIGEQMLNLSFVDWGQIVFSLIAGVFVFLGVYKLRTSKINAYRMFERSILIAIFFTQGFAFYKEQFSALLGLLLNILILLALRYMIKQEEIEQAKSNME